MLLSPIIVGIAALAAGTEAVTSSAGASTTATGTSSTAAATHSVAVGATGFVFDPHEITNASVGDIVEFRFYPTGHWVIRSDFKHSCIPYELTGPNKIGFSSGEIDVATVTNDGPTFQVLINDTEPIFFYCGASGSCTDQHMIGVINPNSTWTYDIQLAYAENATYQLTPGESFPSETASSGSTSATSTAGSPSSSSGSSSDSHLSAGAIAGIAIGAAAVAILAAALLYMCGRRGGMDRAFHHNRFSGAYHNGGGGPGMQEARYPGAVPGPGPRSPGQETFTTAHSGPASTDPYHHHAQAGHPLIPGNGYPPPPSTGSPPPLSEYSQSLYNVHGQYASGVPRMGSPPMGATEGGHAAPNGFFTTPQANGPPQNLRQQSSMQEYAVELPTSLNPGSSPLPGYDQEKTYSWTAGNEVTDRQNKP